MYAYHLGAVAIINILKSAFLQGNDLSKRTNVGVAGRRVVILEGPEVGKALEDPTNEMAPLTARGL